MKIEVYAIVAEEEKQFYVVKTTAGNGRRTYRYHAALQRSQTAEWMGGLLAAGQPPQMYLLAVVEGDDKLAYRHVVAWTWYFAGHGYTPVCSGVTAQYAADIHGVTRDICEAIRAQPLEAVLAPERCLVQGYEQRKTAAKDGKSTIRVELQADERRIVDGRAAALDLSVTQYSKHMLLHGTVYQLPEPLHYDYIRAISGAKASLDRLRRDLMGGGQCSAADLEAIRLAICQIAQTQEAIHRAYCDHTAAVMQLLPRR